MNKTNKAIIGLGMTIAIVLSGFLAFQGFTDSASANSSVTTTTNPGDELIEMFNLGLSKTRSNLPEEDMEQYYAMVEAAIQQCSQYPERMGDFWRLFEKHLRESESVNPVSRVAMVDLFAQQVEQCTNHCKSVEQFNQIWQTQKSIVTYRSLLIRTEAEKALTLLEKVDNSQICQLFKKEIDKQSLQYAQAYSLILEFSDDLPEDLSKRFDNIVQNCGTQLVSEIEQKFATLKKQFEAEYEKSRTTIIEPNRIIPPSGPKPANPLCAKFGTGPIYQLLTQIQNFITQDLNSEAVQLLSTIQSDKMKEIHAIMADIQLQTSELLEKTRILNQMRYNLWAARVIESADKVIQFDKMALISVEFLYPAVSAFYNEKLGEIMNDTKNPEQASSNVHLVILKDKAPLSAF